MSINQIESKIKSLQGEIDRLSRNLEAEVKKEAGYTASINRTTKSITKNTSASSLRTKMRSIESDTDKVNKSKKAQTELQTKISKKKVELAEKQTELQKEQSRIFQEMNKRENAALDSQRKAIADASIQGEPIMTKKYDFFISHATEDKETVAEPLAKALINHGAKVWLDKFSMTVGDSLRQSIDEGLACSRYGIVILSEIYFKKFWTGKELNGLFAKQESGEKVILPVWHNISKNVVMQYSPILADMLALKTADFTIDELAEEFARLL